MRKKKRFFLLSTLCIVLSQGIVPAQTSIGDLRVQHAVEPLAVEDAHPSFSWKMVSSVPGQDQQAYRIQVRRGSDRRLVWDSGEIRDSLSTGIRYLGVALQPCMDYEWELTVTDRDGGRHEASSRFATGLMDPRLSAWKGAAWIGDSRPSLDAASLRQFSIGSDFVIVKGKTAGFVFGADDFRLKDIFGNNWNLAGENYFKVVLDFSGYGTPTGCELRIYRVGYAAQDRADRPLLTVSKATYPATNLNAVLKGGPSADHHLKLSVCDGAIAFAIDGQALATEAGGGQAWLTVSPAGAGQDVNTFPHLCSVGFAAEPGSDVTYTGYRIDAGGQSGGSPLFSGSQQYRQFETLSCVRLPRYRNQLAYENDIVVINKGDREVVESIDPSFGGAKMLRSEFSTAPGKKVRSARLYASALGVYEFYLNGRKVGEDWFAPGVSQYRETVTYQAYDVTPLIRQGRNAMGADLFEGWHSGYVSADPHDYNFYGDTPALLCRLDIRYEDGTAESFVSRPEGWKSFDGGPVRAGSFSQGERYDASREAAVKGWSEPGYDDRDWKTAEKVSLREWMHPGLTARLDGPVRVCETLSAAERATIHSDDYRTHIYDMGMIMTGVPELHVPAGWLRKGDIVTIRYADRLHSEAGIAGHMQFEDRGNAMETDFYIADSEAETVIRPRSCRHTYRFIQVTLPSHEGPLPLQNVKGLFLSSCEKLTATYEAVTEDQDGGERLNQLFSDLQHRQLISSFTLPTDRAGSGGTGTGEAPLDALTASYQADVYNFFRQWMAALRDDQGIGSGQDAPGGVSGTAPEHRKAKEEVFAEATKRSAAICRIPWQMYLQYGDKQIIEDNLESMFNWLNGLAFYPLSDKCPYLSAKADAPAYLHLLDITAQMAEAVGQVDYARVLRERRQLARADWERTGGAVLSPDAAETDGVRMFAHQLGITDGHELGFPGYRHFILQPVAEPGFLSLKGSFESEYGPVASAWTADGSGVLQSYEAAVPANSSATLYLPVPAEAEDFESSEWAVFQGITTHHGLLTAVYELRSGAHAFEISPSGVRVR
ncbi:MAG: family 78 glycoside hydrolase catalytic domain [Bacteroidales bacterium]|nr:family 78 glycoside hydrolase catalytic domain [Bacteroidales bacterium]